jgi:mannose-1-phosphate guanylyltransferase
VRSFHEKPSYDRAKRFVASREYLWNSGIFVFGVSTILRAFGQYLPPLYEGLIRIVEAREPNVNTLRAEYRRLPSISIDHGVMEKVGLGRRRGAGERQGRTLGKGSTPAREPPLRLAVVPGQFSWSDVGSWDALATFWREDRHGNAVEGEAVLIDTRGAAISSPTRLVALLGMEDVIVIDSGDAVLVCPRWRAQEVRRVVEELEKRGLNRYL